jgi:hypothetical protein
LESAGRAARWQQQPEKGIRRKEKSKPAKDTNEVVNDELTLEDEISIGDWPRMSFGHAQNGQVLASYSRPTVVINKEQLGGQEVGGKQKRSQTPKEPQKRHQTRM